MIRVSGQLPFESVLFPDRAREQDLLADGWTGSLDSGIDAVSIAMTLNGIFLLAKI